MEVLLPVLVESPPELLELFDSLEDVLLLGIEVVRPYQFNVLRLFAFAKVCHGLGGNPFLSFYEVQLFRKQLLILYWTVSNKRRTLFSGPFFLQVVIHIAGAVGDGWLWEEVLSPLVKEIGTLTGWKGSHTQPIPDSVLVENNTSGNSLGSSWHPKTYSFDVSSFQILLGSHHNNVPKGLLLHAHLLHLKFHFHFYFIL